MKRRELLKKAAALSMVTAIPFSVPEEIFAQPGPSEQPAGTAQEKSLVITNPLKPPAAGSIPVAFVVSEGVVVIDFAGPWEVFEKVKVPGRSGRAFRPYTVAQTMDPIRVQAGGMKILPEYTFENAPAPKVIVIPAQNGSSRTMVDWVRQSSKDTDVTMSVCTGVFVLAATGLLNGKPATTFHESYGFFSMMFPDVQVKRGLRFVETGNLASSGGLSSGIDLALRVTERYFGREVVRQTAYYLEYQGEGWMHPDSNGIYGRAFPQSNAHPVCPVCGMEPDRSVSSSFKGKTYYFCGQGHKALFDHAPDSYISG